MINLIQAHSFNVVYLVTCLHHPKITATQFDLTFYVFFCAIVNFNILVNILTS